MVTALNIYFRALGIYALVTLPTIFSPIIYMISLFYAIVYGMFACFSFCLLYVTIIWLVRNYVWRMISLILAVAASVAFAFQMLEVCKAQDNVWNSGIFLMFPLAAAIAGWISLSVSSVKIRFEGKQVQLELEQ